MSRLDPHRLAFITLAATLALMGMSGLLSSSGSAAAATASTSTTFPACLQAATTQVAMDQCVGSELRQAQSKLAHQLKNEGKIYGATQVSSAEKPWRTYERAECALEASLTKGGSGYGVNLESCEVALIDTRIGQIQQLLAQHAAEQAAGAAALKTPSGTTSNGPTVSTTLAVVLCPTSDAMALTPTTVAAPTTRTVSIPSALVGRLSVYADSRDRMALVGPKGWACHAQFGADGSGSVIVAPTTERATFTNLSANDEAIVGGESSACVGCTLGQACPLFADAAVTYAQSGFPPCAVKPVTETVLHLSSTVVAFDDPPGVKGDGNPSGGPYTAHGVMTYIPNNENGSWEATCALPDSLKAVCTVSLNSFVAWYSQL